MTIVAIGGALDTTFRIQNPPRGTMYWYSSAFTSYGIGGTLYAGAEEFINPRGGDRGINIQATVTTPEISANWGIRAGRATSLGFAALDARKNVIANLSIDLSSMPEQWSGYTIIGDFKSNSITIYPPGVSLPPLQVIDIIDSESVSVKSGERAPDSLPEGTASGSSKEVSSAPGKTAVLAGIPLWLIAGVGIIILLMRRK